MMTGKLVLKAFTVNDEWPPLQCDDTKHFTAGVLKLKQKKVNNKKKKTKPLKITFDHHHVT